MDHLRLSRNQLLSASVAPNTLSVYSNALSTFEHFRNRYNLGTMWPVPIQHITLFIAHSFELGYSPATVASYLSGVAFYHKLQNYPDPTAAFVVKKLLEGFKRSRRRYDIRAPITENILRRICTVLPDICYSDYEACLFKSAYLLAYFALLRVSEIVFSSYIQADRPLLSEDVKLLHDHTALIITIRLSKTNQRGMPTVMRIPSSGSPSFCCVAAVQHYLCLRPSNAHYFFAHINGTPLTRSQFSAVLAKAIHTLRLPTNIYTSHSFRIGRATDLSSKGLSSDIIKKLGRWRSDVVNRYIRF